MKVIVKLNQVGLLWYLVYSYCTCLAIRMMSCGLLGTPGPLGGVVVGEIGPGEGAGGGARLRARGAGAGLA